MTATWQSGGADTREARLQLEEGSRPTTDKVMTAADAVRQFVSDGDVIGVGGTNHARTPMALLTEVLRQGRRELSLARPLTCYEAELFIATGMAERVVTSWVGIGHGWGLAQVLREYVEDDRVAYEEWSHLGLGLRYKAGAMGVPFLPTLSMLGSDIMSSLGLSTVDCPYTGQALCAVPSLNPDVALIHVQRADVLGNAQIDGYELMDADLARAARRLVVSAEEIVPTSQLQLDPAKTLVPSFAVDAVVLQPMGAYPHECYGHYEADLEAFSEYVDAVTKGGAEGARAYVEELTRHPDFDAYLSSVDPERRVALGTVAKELLPQ